MINPDEFEKYDLSEKVGLYQPNNKPEMFTVTKTNIKSAVMSVVLTAVLGMAAYIVGIGDVFNIDIHSLANIGALAFLNGLISLCKAFLTTSEGNLAGVKVVE